jgi:hypothetical protein
MAIRTLPTGGIGMVRVSQSLPSVDLIVNWRVPASVSADSGAITVADRRIRRIVFCRVICLRSAEPCPIRTTRALPGRISSFGICRLPSTRAQR